MKFVSKPVAIKRLSNLRSKKKPQGKESSYVINISKRLLSSDLYKESVIKRSRPKNKSSRSKYSKKGSSKASRSSFSSEESDISI